MKSITAILLFALLTVACKTSHAAITYSIDVDTSAVGIQNTRAVMANDQIVADVVLVLDGTTTLGNYAVSMRFDSSELQFVSGTEAPPTGLNSINAIAVSATDSEVLVGIEAGTFGGGVVAPSTFTIASLTFNVQTPTGDTSDIDLTLFEDPILDGSFDNSFNQLQEGNDLFFNNASITLAAVPEPSSMLASGVVLCVMVRRQQRRNRNK